MKLERSVLEEMRDDALSDISFTRAMRASAAAVEAWERQHPTTLATGLDWIRRLRRVFEGLRSSDEPTRGEEFPLL